MDLETYHRVREKQKIEQKTFRELCLDCRQPQFSCYCHHLNKFDPKITFVILIHPIEVRRRIATGRMSHLSLENSYLIKGENYSENETVNNLIEDPRNFPVVLYPGSNSTNLTDLTNDQKAGIFQIGKRLVIFVMDGTWNTARKMISKSFNLKSLPRICFYSEKPSNFRVRRQPKAGCFSTIEAIHQTIELVGPSVGFDIATRAHDSLTNVFDQMIDQQVEFRTEARERTSYRLPERKRSA